MPSKVHLPSAVVSGIKVKAPKATEDAARVVLSMEFNLDDAPLDALGRLMRTKVTVSIEDRQGALKFSDE